MSQCYGAYDFSWKLRIAISSHHHVKVSLPEKTAWLSLFQVSIHTLYCRLSRNGENIAFERDLSSAFVTISRFHEFKNRMVDPWKKFKKMSSKLLSFNTAVFECLNRSLPFEICLENWVFSIFLKTQFSKIFTLKVKLIE